jgi:hypothetical protein
MSSIVSFNENTQNKPLYNGINYNITALKEYYNNTNNTEHLEEDQFYSDVTTSDESECELAHSLPRTSDEEEEEYITPHIKELDFTQLNVTNPLNSNYGSDYVYYYKDIKHTLKPLFFLTTTNSGKKYNVYPPCIEHNNNKDLEYINGLFVPVEHIDDYMDNFITSTEYKKLRRLQLG